MSIAPKTSLLSVVIPTLNEEATLTDALAPLLGIDGVEIIVADGGSVDQTIVIAEKAGAIIVRSRQGRGLQQNRGAAVASGDILLFLHADTILPVGFPTMVRNFLELEGVVAGAFSLSVDLPGIGIRFIEKMANWRSRWLGLPYGDQALFLKAETFRRAGGFPNLEIMEDFALLKTIGKMGKIRILPERIVTSGRRWQKLGILRTTLINQMVIIGYLLGCSPTSLANWYRRSSKAR